MDSVIGKLITPLQGVELDDEGAGGDFSSQLFNQLAACLSGPAGGNEIVDEQDPVARVDGVGVHFQRGGSVFEIIGGTLHVIGELAGFAQRNEADAKLPGNQAAEDEAAGPTYFRWLQFK